MRPAGKLTDKPIEEGSPTPFPRANSGVSGTADESSVPEQINHTEQEQETDTVSAGPVPLFLVPQTISSEIHAHGGGISAITVRRTGQHVYAITLTKLAKRHARNNAKKTAGDGRTNTDQNGGLA